MLKMNMYTLLIFYKLFPILAKFTQRGQWTVVTLVKSALAVNADGGIYSPWGEGFEYPY